MLKYCPLVQSHFDRYKNVPNAKVWKESPLPGAGATFDLGSHLVRSDHVHFVLFTVECSLDLLRDG